MGRICQKEKFYHCVVSQKLPAGSKRVSYHRYVIASSKERASRLAEQLVEKEEKIKVWKKHSTIAMRIHSRMEFEKLRQQSCVA